jgi:outer membrane protein
MKKLFFTFLSLLFAGFIFAQPGLKLGHINSQELLQAMPENDTAQAKLEKIAKEFQSQIEAMQVEFNNKYQDYTSKLSTFSDLVRQTKETELQEMNQRIQQFQTSAQEDMSKKRTEIYKPVLDKANKAISEVAKENNFTYIFDLSAGTVIYHADYSIDILPLVKQKLGLK